MQFLNFEHSDRILCTFDHGVRNYQKFVLFAFFDRERRRLGLLWLRVFVTGLLWLRAFCDRSFVTTSILWPVFCDYERFVTTSVLWLRVFCDRSFVTTSILWPVFCDYEYFMTGLLWPVFFRGVFYRIAHPHWTTYIPLTIKETKCSNF